MAEGHSQGDPLFLADKVETPRSRQAVFARSHCSWLKRNELPPADRAVSLGQADCLDELLPRVGVPGREALAEQTKALLLMR